MKRRAVTYLLSMLIVSSFASITLAKTPIVSACEFRTPYSLNEFLHDGLVDVQSRIADLLESDQGYDQQLEQVCSDLQALQLNFDCMIDQSNIHRVHRGDREYLQGVIDRIDHLIDLLETKRGLGLDEFSAHADTVQKLLEELRSKLA